MRGTYGKLLVAHHHQQSQLCTYQSWKHFVSNVFMEMILPFFSDDAAAAFEVLGDHDGTGRR